MRNVRGARTGFTMVELMLVITTIGVIGVVALPQFVDFRVEARNAAAMSFISNLRTAIDNKKTQMVVRCAAGLDAWPSLNAIMLNDITEGGSTSAACTTTQIGDPEERKFLATGDLVVPLNPNNNLQNLATCNCTDLCDTSCSGTVGFCYNPATGDLWGTGLVDACRGLAGGTTTTTTGTATTTAGGTATTTTTTTGGDTGGSSVASCTPGTSYGLNGDNNCVDNCTNALVDYSLCEGGSSSSSSTGGGSNPTCDCSQSGGFGTPCSDPNNGYSQSDYGDYYNSYCASSSSSSTGGGSYCTWDDSGVCTAYSGTDSGNSSFQIFGAGGAQYCCQCTDNTQNPPVTGIGDSCSWQPSSSSSMSSNSCGSWGGYYGDGVSACFSDQNCTSSIDMCNCTGACGGTTGGGGPPVCGSWGSYYGDGSTVCYSDPSCTSSIDICNCQGSCSSSSSNPNCVQDGSGYTNPGSYGTCYYDSNCTQVMGTEGQQAYSNGGDNGQGSCYCSQQTFSAGGCSWSGNGQNVDPTLCGCNPNQGECEPNGNFYSPYGQSSCYTDSACNNQVDQCNCQGNCPVYGCTNPSASNYNPQANTDDGSCQYTVYGCTNPSANNYNPMATVDDGSCQIYGCTDPNASNYNSSANYNDGSCQYSSSSSSGGSYPTCDCSQANGCGIPCLDPNNGYGQTDYCTYYSQYYGTYCP